MSSTSITRVCPHCQTVYGYKEEHICDRGPPSLPPDDPLIGAVLGERYQVESFLSSGGMGVVYKARHTVLDKPLAIKLMREAQDPVAQQRFLLEAKAAVHIGHEHIVDINDYGVIDDGRPYLVMEFLQGQSLEAVIAKGPLPWQRAIRIAEQISRGLQAVHEKGILHRDLKPGNVYLLDRQRRDFVKILDFGIAKVMAGTRETLTEGGGSALPNLRATTQGMVLGTPEYLSPEQASGEPIDARVDQYALGCILYEMLTGVVPFRGNGPMSTLMKHLTEKPVPPRKRKPELNIPEAVERICLKAMAQRKDDRYASMEELGNALLGEIEQTNSYVGDASVPGLPAGSWTGSHSQVAAASGPNAATQKAPLPSNVERKQRRLIVVLIATISVLVLALVLALILYLTLRNKTKTPTVVPQDAGTVAPPDLHPPDAGAKPGPEETPPSQTTVKVGFVNKTLASVSITCPGQPRCVLKNGTECAREIPEGGRCTASAPGFKSRDFDYATARKLPKKAKGKLMVQLPIDISGAGGGGGKAGGGKSGPTKAPTPTKKTK